MFVLGLVSINQMRILQHILSHTMAYREEAQVKLFQNQEVQFLTLISFLCYFRKSTAVLNSGPHIRKRTNKSRSHNAGDLPTTSSSRHSSRNKDRKRQAGSHVTFMNGASSMTGSPNTVQVSWYSL